jgi:hypothetical protein
MMATVCDYDPILNALVMREIYVQSLARCFDRRIKIGSLVHTYFSKCVSLYFAFLMNLDTYLLHIKIIALKVNAVPVSHFES